MRSLPCTLAIAALAMASLAPAAAVAAPPATAAAPAPAPATGTASETYAGAIVPLDGTWQMESSGMSHVGCNPMIAQMMNQMGAGQGETETRQIAWGGEFNPNTVQFFREDEMADVTWVRTGPNSYEADMSQANEGMPMQGAQLELEIIAPTNIIGSADMDLEAMLTSLGAGAMLGQLGLGDCAIAMNFRMHHLGY